MQNKKTTIHQNTYEKLEKAVESLKKNPCFFDFLCIKFLIEMQREYRIICIKNDNLISLEKIIDKINQYPNSNTEINKNFITYKDFSKNIIYSKYNNPKVNTGNNICAIGTFFLVAGVTYTLVGSILSLPPVFFIALAIIIATSSFLGIKGILLKKSGKEQGLSRSINQFFQFIDQIQPDSSIPITQIN